ncbi:hypothetical protein [Mycoplasma sp. 480]|uniref:hypothetical protein n=1 Tax=Mycoplasma sp. 480 TaxID=3440155 RepID=UPI003F50F1DC
MKNNLEKLKNFSKTALILEIVTFALFVISVIILIAGGVLAVSAFGYYSPSEARPDQSASIASFGAAFILAILLIVVASGTGLAALVFKIIICVELSNFEMNKVQTILIFFILSIFFGLLFTILGFVYVKKLEE